MNLTHTIFLGTSHWKLELFNHQSKTFFLKYGVNCSRTSSSRRVIYIICFIVIYHILINFNYSRCDVRGYFATEGHQPEVVKAFYRRFLSGLSSATPTLTSFSVGTAANGPKFYIRLMGMMDPNVAGVEVICW